MIMDKYDGDLNDLIKLYHTDKSIPMDGILETMKQLIQTFHDNGMVHRDLYLRNFFYTKEGVIALADYGAAVVSNSEQLRKEDWQKYDNMSYIINEVKLGNVSDLMDEISEAAFYRTKKLLSTPISKIEVLFNGKICSDIWGA